MSSPVPPNKRRRPENRASFHHGDLPRALLDAAAEVIVERGIHDLSLREVARRAGVSHGAVGYHFGDKEGLLRALGVEGWQRMSAALVEADAARSSTDPVARLMELAVDYASWAQANPGYLDVMWRADLLPAEVTDAFTPRNIAFRFVTECAAEAQAAGWRSEWPLGLATFSSIVVAHGIASLAVSGALRAIGGGGEVLAAMREITAFAAAYTPRTWQPDETIRTERALGLVRFGLDGVLDRGDLGSVTVGLTALLRRAVLALDLDQLPGDDARWVVAARDALAQGEAD